jgi:hypothetical protein
MLTLGSELQATGDLACSIDSPGRLRVEYHGDVIEQVLLFVEEFEYGVRTCAWLGDLEGLPVVELAEALRENGLPVGLCFDAYGGVGFTNLQFGEISVDAVRQDLFFVGAAVQAASALLNDRAAQADVQHSPVSEDGYYGEGEYRVGAEIPAGLYRVRGYCARLGIQREIITNESASSGWGLMRVWESDDLIEVSELVVAIERIPCVDPLQERFRDGTYLVGPDIDVGSYVLLAPGTSAFFCLLDEDLNRIENGFSKGSIHFKVTPAVFAVQIDGLLQRDPGSS